jgi:hypothetical protein
MIIKKRPMGADRTDDIGKIIPTIIGYIIRRY